MHTCVTPTLSWAAALTLMLPFPVTGPPAGEVIRTVGGIVSAATGAGAVTVTMRLAVPVLPAGSCAATDSVWVPATVPAFQPNAKEALVVELTSTPSQYNLTLLMPRLSLAAPLTVTVPETVLPAVGAEIATEGGGLTGPASAALTGFCSLQGGLLALGFLHTVLQCGGSCGVVVELVREAPRGDGKSYCRARALFLRPKGK